MGRVNAERVIGESGIQTNEQCATIWPLPLVSRGLVVLCVYLKGVCLCSVLDHTSMAKINIYKMHPSLSIRVSLRIREDLILQVIAELKEELHPCLPVIASYFKSCPLVRVVLNPRDLYSA